MIEKQLIELCSFLGGKQQNTIGLFVDVPFTDPVADCCVLFITFTEPGVWVMFLFTAQLSVIVSLIRQMGSVAKRRRWAHVPDASSAGP